MRDLFIVQKVLLFLKDDLMMAKDLRAKAVILIKTIQTLTLLEVPCFESPLGHIRGQGLKFVINLMQKLNGN